MHRIAAMVSLFLLAAGQTFSQLPEKSGVKALTVKADVSIDIDHIAVLINNSFHRNSAAYGGSIFSDFANPLI